MAILASAEVTEVVGTHAAGAELLERKTKYGADDGEAGAHQTDGGFDGGPDEGGGGVVGRVGAVANGGYGGDEAEDAGDAGAKREIC